MSSSLRIFPALPSNLRTYVSATTNISDDLDVNAHKLDSDGKWDVSLMSAADISSTIFEDLGKVVFHNPNIYADATISDTTPPVDVRKIRPVSSDGKIIVDSSFYASLGTRVRDTTGKTTTPIEACWFGLNASGTVGRQ